MSLRRILFFAFALTLMLVAPRLHAQSTGTIRGTVTDATAASVPGATVTVTNPATGLTRTVETNGTGEFVFPDLPIGSYTIQTSKTGFDTEKRSATELLTGQTLGLDISLKVGSQTLSVEVTSDTHLGGRLHRRPAADAGPPA